MINLNFNVDYLNEVVMSGNKMLLNKKLSSKMKKIIKADINVFQNFINKNYDFPIEKPIYNSNYSLKKLKKLFLQEAKEHYEFLGEDLLNFIINLNKEQIFSIENTYYENILPVTKQAELTLKNYSLLSKKMYKYAKKIIIDKSVSQIQIVNDDRITSFCHYSDIAKLPFLIIEPTDCNNTFNHEVHHAIEDMLKLKVPTVFLELGSITLELLFNDRLFEYQNYLNGSDYEERIGEIAVQLIELTDYFLLLKELKKYDFKPDKKEFIKLCEKNIQIEKSNIKNYLLEILNEADYDSYMCYTLSFLKAIELREEINNSNFDALEVLKSYYTKLKFEIPKDGFKIYEKYIEEMHRKTKNHF